MMTISELMTSSTNQILDPAIQFIEQFAFLGKATYVAKLPALDALLAPAADSLGMQLAVIKYTVSLFLAYPFAAILRAIPHKNLKHFLSLIGGLFLVQWIFEEDWIHTFVSSAVTYLICLIAPRKQLPLIAFIWVMGYMTGAHIYRMYVSYLSGVFDFTGTQMVLTMKLTSFAYNLYDGTADKERVFQTYSDSKKSKVYADRKRFAIQKLPNPLEFFGYIYCFTCLLAGPAFEYNDYVQSIDGSAFVAPGDEGKPKKAEPSSVVPALIAFAKGVICMVGYVVVPMYLPLKVIFDPAFQSSTDYLYKFVYLYFSLAGERMKYYFAWNIAEGASVMGGFGFQGYAKDGKVIGWKGVQNIDMLGFETAPNVQSLSRAWNKRTQGWLERYTYNRFGQSLFVTYFVSAIWHGLYPGFFIFFFTVPILTNIERLFRAKINPLVVPEYDGRDLKTYPNSVAGKVYWFMSWFGTNMSVNYFVQVFNFGSWERCMVALGGFHHLPHVAILLTWLVLELLPKSGPKKKKE